MPIEEGHRDQGADDHDAAIEHYEQHLDIQGLDGLGIVGDPAHQLPGDCLVEKCHRQPQHMAVDLLAQAPHERIANPASRSSCR